MGFYSLVFAWLTSTALLLLPDRAFARTVAVIAGSDFPVATVSQEELSQIYLGEKTMVNGVRLQPLDNSDTALKEAFFNALLKMGADDFNTHWIGKNFQDGLKVPEPTSSAQMASKVKEPGRLGYVDAADAKDPGVKTLMTLETK